MTRFPLSRLLEANQTISASDFIASVLAGYLNW